MTKRGLWIFLTSLVLVTWVIECLAIYYVGDLDSPAAAPWLLAVMFAPTLWSVVYLAFHRESFSVVAWKPGKLSGLLLGALTPVGVAIATVGVIIHLQQGASQYFIFGGAGVSIARGPWLFGVGEQSWAFFTANIFVTAIVFAVINGVVTVGEEFGWRGLLQPMMIERFGITRGVAILGFVWAIWHLPANLSGYNYPEAPVLGALVIFPIELIAASFIMAAITIWARSFWPAVLMHGSINSVFESIISRIDLVEGMSPIYGHLVSIAFLVGLAVLSWLLLITVLRRGANV